ncbi:Uma2 family endonuclease [Roseofilum casamattae]|uniref:Uma2 family endonuclease n=1 Tax=Roseofilum casamattae BLCC-M143 TaxID=3022442 RepID=A0ABT7C0C7_9CYAN|nr:Uma2 family endonuclease [Roseofilum casamattae]MDJ1184907.1 Uma2 family endonuclease [Roseofilum casamattae BLCC-M143]
MTQLRDRPIDPSPNSTDKTLIVEQRTWEQFQWLRQGFEGTSGVRLGYYRGTIEIVMPGEEHEFFKTIIGFLIELFLIEKGIDLIPAGSMTQEKKGLVSLQADESYWIIAKKEIPDLSIEVIFTSGNSSKLERYQALGVPEVWFWEDGVFALYHLREDGYDRIEASELPGLTELNIQLLSQCVLLAQTSRVEAVRQFRQGI